MEKTKHMDLLRDGPTGARVRWGALGAALALLAVVVGTNDLVHATSSRSAQMAFRKGSGIYLIHSDGTHLRRLTPQYLRAYEPAWSPDGTRIAFACRSRGESRKRLDICILTLKGGRVQRIIQREHAEISPTWNPDGTHLAFVRMMSPTEDVPVMLSDIFRVNVKSGREMRLTHTGVAAQPEWSPDGDEIVFVSQTEDPDIWTVTGNGSTVRNLSSTSGDPGADETRPSWSPDGTTIIYSRWIESGDDPWGSYHIWTMTSAGTNAVPLPVPAVGEGAKYSPDGSRIVFFDLVGRNTDGIFRMRSDGSRRRVVHFDPRVQSVDPVWAPSP